MVLVNDLYISNMHKIFIVFERHKSLKATYGLKFLYKIPMNTYVC